MNNQNKKATNEQIDILIKTLRDNNLIDHEDLEKFFKEIFKEMDTHLITEITRLYTKKE